VTLPSAAAERLAAELGQPIRRWYNTRSRIGRALLAGRLDEAERLSLEALELGQAIGQRDAHLYFTAQRFQVRFEQGRLGELETFLAETTARTPGLRSLQVMRTLLYAEHDRDDDAAAVFDSFAASNFEHLPQHPTRLAAMTMSALVAAHLGDVARAAVLHDLLTPHAADIDTATGIVRGAVAHHIGMLATTLGRFDEAETHFAAASATHSRMRAPTLMARTRLEWARMLLGRRGAGDAERARELLQQALSTARELGLGNVERQTVGLLGGAMLSRQLGGD
jgi:tetratricopeptide (TPR) repeat protein